MLNITESTCRVCLEDQNVLINIYEELEELNTNLSSLLETCANLQINEEDIFPKYLCEDCTRELLITSKFREKCNKSKEILFEILENTKIESETYFESHDIIEYGPEDINNLEVEDLIIEDQSGDIEYELDKIAEDVTAPEEQEAAVSLLRKNCNETEANDQEIENEMESAIPEEEGAEVTEDNKEVVHMLIDDSKRDDISSIIINWNNADLAMQEEPINASSTKSLNEKIKRINLFKCDICGAIFKQAINLQKHILKSHDPIHCFTCAKCNYCFSLENEFHKHCESCNYLETVTEVSKDNKKLKTEKLLTKLLLPDTDRKCVYCERDFATPFAMRMHLRTHTGERPFKCKYCETSFKTQSQLNVHHKRHTGQADFICTICNKAFYEHSNLTVHMRSHTGERPHVCTVCNKSFTRVCLLEFHMRTHTGEKPYKCNYCDKCFRQHTDLRNHLTIHTGQKQYSCDLCGKSYIKRSHLMEHMRKHQLANHTEETHECLQYDNINELNTATNNIQNYVQNPEILYNFDEIIESESVVQQAEEHS